MGKRTDKSQREIDTLTERAAPLLAAVRAAPDDDAPRLILADWLEETGEPLRAELIRTQIECHRRDVVNPDFIEYSPRVRELIALHGKRWMGPFAEIEYDAGCKFHRGLLSVSTTASSLQAKALRELAGHPHWAWVSQFYVGTCADDHPQDVLTSPLLSEVTHLQLSSAPDDAVQEVADSTQFPRLYSLTVHSRCLTDRLMDALASASWLGQIRWLDIASFQEGTLVHGIATLVGALRSAHLRGLQLALARTGDEGATLLVQSPHLAGLTALSLFGLCNAGGIALAQSPHLAGLTRLSLGSRSLGDTAVIALAKSPHLAGLTTLSLWDCSLGDPAGKALAQSPYLGGLRELNVAKNRFGRETIEALLRRFGTRLLWRDTDPFPSQIF